VQQQPQVNAKSWSWFQALRSRLKTLAITAPQHKAGHYFMSAGGAVLDHDLLTFVLLDGMGVIAVSITHTKATWTRVFTFLARRSFRWLVLHLFAYSPGITRMYEWARFYANWTWLLLSAALPLLPVALLQLVLEYEQPPCFVVVERAMQPQEDFFRCAFNPAVRTPTVWKNMGLAYDSGSSLRVFHCEQYCLTDR